MRAHDEEYVRDYIRMPPRTFDTLLELVRDKIRNTNNWRKAITPEQRLIVTLRRRFLAAGQYLRGASFNNCMGRSTVCGIIQETCQALWDVLQPLYLTCPQHADCFGI